MRKLCPNCEELLKPTSNPEVGQCSGCGWSGHYWRAAKETSSPTATRSCLSNVASCNNLKQLKGNPVNNDIRESLSRLGQINPADLGAASTELTTLLAELRKEVETQTNVVNAADSADPAYSSAASDLVGLLQLTQVAVDSKTELGKLAMAAGKAMSRVLKKAPTR